MRSKGGIWSISNEFLSHSKNKENMLTPILAASRKKSYEDGNQESLPIPYKKDISVGFLVIEVWKLFSMKNVKRLRHLADLPSIDRGH